MKKTIKVANVVVENTAGKILLLKRSKNLKQTGFWALPGGLIEENESAETAAIRELKEETGIEKGKFSIILSKKFLINKPEENIIIVTFLTNLTDESPIILDPHEHSDYQWILPSKILEVENLLPGIPTMLKNLLNLVELADMVDKESAVISYVP